MTRTTAPRQAHYPTGESNWRVQLDMAVLEPSEIPSFCWDRDWSVDDIRLKLRKETGDKRDQLVAWILREASFREVWLFLTPEEVAECLPRVEPFLGRWRGFWKYIIGAWRELGKI